VCVCDAYSWIFERIFLFPVEAHARKVDSFYKPVLYTDTVGNDRLVNISEAAGAFKKTISFTLLECSVATLSIDKQDPPLHLKSVLHISRGGLNERIGA
jgi:hypothetical protein